MAVEKILVIDDEPFIRKTFEEVLRGKRYGVSSASSIAEAERLMKREQFDVVFVDVRLPDGEGMSILERVSKGSTPPLAIMMSGFGTIESAVECMRAGAFDYLTKPFSISQIEVLVKKAESYRQMLQVNEYLSAELAGAKDLVGASEEINRLRDMLRKVAPTEATVLIQGENGTGKELVALSLYHSSTRSHLPYIRVNCAALSENLMESEFFGHEKGAFTGAMERREGRFELANGGTLLLDEISEISPRLQAKLLRVLQEKEFERVGGVKTIQVDVRVLATTNRDLRKAVEKGDFREDLYYRLNVFPVSVPPLRERTGDIRVLAEYFLARFAKQYNRSDLHLSPECHAALDAHRWPGNVRELQNAVERAVIMSEPGAPLISSALGLPGIQTLAVPVSLKVNEETESASSINGHGSGPLGDSRVSLAALEKEHILRVLSACADNRTRAADALQISIRTLRNKLHEYRLAKDE
ncbi:MAG: nitrogen regulation response regulator NtrX [Verrucomicrobia bacterium]|nr:MAG: nitrogen regulation response regulator NtrX [Verrucomicrobiota bacterium]